MTYEYKMVQIPQDMTVKMKEQRGNEAAAYLESIANSQAVEGWEFYRVDEVGVLARPRLSWRTNRETSRIHALLCGDLS